jgi:hypothetical protein
VELIFDRFNKAWTQPVFFDNLPTAVQYPANHDPGIRVYPNPASQECQVEFNLIEKQSVRSDLYNLQGQLIRTFLNDVQAAGKHMISLDIRDIPAGSYLLKLSGEQFNYTERVIVF